MAFPLLLSAQDQNGRIFVEGRLSFVHWNCLSKYTNHLSRVAIYALALLDVVY